MILYEDLEKYYNKPNDWIPAKQAFFGRHKRIPRKLKKKGRRCQEKHPYLEINQCL